MWLKENAECMLVIRAAVLTDRWNETLEHVRATMAKSRRLDWPWSSPDILAELKSFGDNAQSEPESTENQVFLDKAA